MAVFAFDEQEQTTTSESIRVGDDAPESANVTENVIANVEHKTISDTAFPSRTTKPIDTQLIIFLLVMVPIFVAAIEFCVSPRVRDFFCARALQLMQKPKDAIPFYTNALKQERDPVTLRYRADAYEEIDDPIHQRADLMDSLAMNPDQDGAFVTAAALQVRCGNPEAAAPLLKRYANLQPNPLRSSESWTNWRNQQVAYNMLLLGNTKDATEFANQLPNSDEDKTVITALALRQESNLERSRKTISELKDSDEPWVFHDSRARYRESTAKDSILALLALDERKVGEAESKLIRLNQIVRDSSRKDDMDRPVIDVLQGWLLLEQGQIDQCLNLSAKLLDNKELTHSLEGLNIKAALHLMRYRAFLKQNNLPAALKEDRLYKDTHCPGTLFAPVWAW